MNNQQMLKANIAAVKFLQYEYKVESTILDKNKVVWVRHGRPLVENKAQITIQYRAFNLLKDERDCLAVVKKLKDKQISIRVGGDGWAYYDESVHVWGISYYAYEEAVAAAVLHVIEE